MSAINDIDEKGRVKFYGAIFGNEDRGGDIIMPGAFTKTLQENFSEILHLKNHDPAVMPGVFHSIIQNDIGLLADSKLILNTKDGRDTYEQYKAMAEADKPMRHSMGYVAVKGIKTLTGRKLSELFLAEISTLTQLAMNPEATSVSVKSLFDDYSIDELLKEEKYFSLLLNAKYEDIELKNLESLKNHISALIEAKSRDTTPPPQEPQGINWELISKYL